LLSNQFIEFIFADFIKARKKHEKQFFGHKNISIYIDNGRSLKRVEGVELVLRNFDGSGFSWRLA